MNGRIIIGVIWLLVSVVIFNVTMEPGSAPTAGEALGMTIVFVIASGVWSVFCGMVALLFTRSK